MAPSSSRKPPRRAFRTAIVAVSIALALTTTALAVDVSGTLQIPRDFGATARDADGESRDYYWQEWNGVLDPRPARFDATRNLAVVLVGDAPAEVPPSDFAIRNGNFAPSTIVVKTGTTLRIENTDAMGHELFAEGLEGFAPLQTAPGNARSLQMGTAGHWVIRDRNYPHVVAHLHVLSDLVARARVDADGRFTFSNAPPGTYTLKVFHGEHELASKPNVVVGNSALTLDPIALTAR